MKDENMFKKKRRERRTVELPRRTTYQPYDEYDGIEPIEEYQPQHDQAEQFYDAHNEMIKFTEMRPPTDEVDARNIKSKNDMTLRDLRDVVNNPSPNGKYAMKINGRTIDLRQLEEYVLRNNQFSQLSRIKRYYSGLINDDIKNYDGILHKAQKHRKRK